jgi:hypothetical protein
MRAIYLQAGLVLFFPTPLGVYIQQNNENTHKIFTFESSPRLYTAHKNLVVPSRGRWGFTPLTPTSFFRNGSSGPPTHPELEEWGGLFCSFVCMVCPFVHVFVLWCVYICCWWFPTWQNTKSGPMARISSQTTGGKRL